MNDELQGTSGNPTGHGIRTGYDRALTEIKDGVLRMGTLVEDQVRAAIASLAGHDVAKANVVIEGDRKINELQQRTTALIAGAIATQNPVARDLRYLLTLDHVAYELERMGDHASSVAKQARRLAPLPPLAESALLVELGGQVAELSRNRDVSAEAASAADGEGSRNDANLRAAARGTETSAVGKPQASQATDGHPGRFAAA